MRYFTSDLHLGHRSIIKNANRPFESVSHQTAVLEAIWYGTVGADDEVYVLGDFLMGDGSDLRRVSRWPGRIKVVPGNHDMCHPMHAEHAKAARRLRHYGIEVLDPQVSIEIGAHEVLLCHFPPDGDSRAGRMRYPEWRPSEIGWIVHGHVHTMWRQRGQWINAGVDAWAGRPVSEKVIAELMEDGPRDIGSPGW
jgi:calcineurin-like phosphoesterase family protein